MIEIKLPNVNIKQVILLVTVSQEKKTRTHCVINAKRLRPGPNNIIQ